MQLISLLFFCFVAIVFLVLYCINRQVKNEDTNIAISKWILVISSYVFVIYADWRFAVILGIVTISTYFCTKNTKTNWVGIFVALGALAIFKYMNFFIESFSAIVGNDYVTLKLILPLGISFYSFSAIGYIFDVRRGKMEPKGLNDVALYLAFFPKLTSGPIQKSGDFFEQINRIRSIGWCSFEPGVQIFVFGLFKKTVLADRLSIFVDQVYATPMAFSSLTVWGASIAYSLQIYFDFSGYSDMAIGVAKILGFEFPRNFNLPYVSHNVTEFWKRWHITLSSWLQEYLYIGMGGNRKGKIRTYFNLICTMVLGGIWHGANWTYVVWGLLHGIALAIHKIWMKMTKSDKKNTYIGNCISILLTFLFTTICWIFFRAETISQAFTIINRIICFDDGVQQPYMWLFIAIIVLICVTALAYIKTNKENTNLKKRNVSIVDGYYPQLNLSSFWGLVWFFVFLGSVLCFAYTGGSPFIYGNY